VCYRYRAPYEDRRKIWAGPLRSVRSFFFGYAVNYKGYRSLALDLTTGKVYTSRQVVFNVFLIPLSMRYASP